MPEDYDRFAADMARASAQASLDALRRQVCELNRRVDRIESRLASEFPVVEKPVPVWRASPNMI